MGAADLFARLSRSAQVRYRTRSRGLVRRLNKQMANIESQRKRNKRTERERIENRRLTSKVKTYFRRLETAVEAKDQPAADSEHRELVSAIDRAVGRGAMHAKTGARRKARAARARNSVSAAD